MKKVFPLSLTFVLFSFPAAASPFFPASALKDKEYSLGTQSLLLGGNRGFVNRAAIGFGEGIELGLSYLSGFPTPLFQGPALDLQVQLLSPTWQRPTGVTLGLDFLGLPGDNPYALGNNIHLLASYDLNAKLNGQSFTLLTGHLGFRADQALRARLLGGISLPLGKWGDVLIEAHEEQADSPRLFHLGAKIQPLEALPGFSLSATSLAVPGNTSLWERHLAIGMAFQGSR
ncbi:MAG TPA: hypothetical protein V6C82_01215 [Chroococcales cyanobacterium]|jgi:hypothetical protein